MRQGATAGLPKKRNRAPIYGGRVVLTQFVQMSVAFQPRAGCVFLEHLEELVLVIGPYTKPANAAASVYAFPWMGPKSTTSFILIVRSFTCRPSHDMGPIFFLRTDARSTRRF